MEDFEAPPMLPIARDMNGTPWENKPEVQVERKLARMDIKEQERSLIEGALAERNWQKFLDRLNYAYLTEDDVERRDQIKSFVERNLL